MKIFLAGIVLAVLACACGRSADRRSAVQSLASTANDQLLRDLDKGELKLRDVLAKKEFYGLSDKEVSVIRNAFSDDEYQRLVLNLIDPNKKRGMADPQWLWLPSVSDDSSELKNLEGVDRNGRAQLINGADHPEKLMFPVITLAYSEKIQGAIPLKLADATEGALMLNTVEFSDVHEPWIKGDAEIYAVVSFIGKDGKGTSSLVEFPSVTKANVKYDLRQLLHMWPQNRFQILNVAFFEHDSGYNYAEITKMFITAASSIVTAVIDPTQTTTIAIAGIVGQLAGKIVDALPAGTFTDDDDYVDTINTIEKYTPGLRLGASGNAKADFSFYEVKINDE